MGVIPRLAERVAFLVYYAANEFVEILGITGSFHTEFITISGRAINVSISSIL